MNIKLFEKFKLSCIANTYCKKRRERSISEWYIFSIFLELTIRWWDEKNAVLCKQISQWQKNPGNQTSGHRCKLYQPIKTNVNNQWFTAVWRKLVFRWLLDPYKHYSETKNGLLGKRTPDSPLNSRLLNP